MPGQAIISVNENQWQVSLATTYAELTTGLSGVESVPAQTGMLFILGEKRQVTVDTSGMLFPLDIIFISDNTVIDVAADIPPGYLVTEETPCDMFLEVNAGEVVGVVAGDAVATEIMEPPGTSFSQIIGMAIPLALLGFVCATAGGVMKLASGGGEHHSLGHHSEKPLTPKAYKVRFIGACKVVDGLCHTHGYSVSKEVKCPDSELTKEEWAAAWELAHEAFPEGQPNPWVNGWWPKTLHEAETVVRKYENKMEEAVANFRARQYKAIENYEGAAGKAISNYRQYVMREYERGRELPVAR